ncbi:MAG: helix-turn-helix transcriptional regulator [Bacteroidales bacterium]|nr:helix-turn-helix transcriptional regulator [Bacteroidales bacterium]
MNMKFDKNKIENSFARLFQDKTPEDKIRRKAYLLMARFLSEVEAVRIERNLKKKDIARMLGISASYLSQLYNGDKLLNLETLARLQEALDIRFDIKAVSQTAPLVLEKDKLKFIQKFYYREAMGFWTYKQYKQRITEPVYNQINTNKTTDPHIEVA